MREGKEVRLSDKVLSPVMCRDLMAGGKCRVAEKKRLNKVGYKKNLGKVYNEWGRISGGLGEEVLGGRGMAIDGSCGKFLGSLESRKCTDRNFSDFIKRKKVCKPECGFKVSFDTMKDENCLPYEKTLIFGKAVSRKVGPRASSVDFAGKFCCGNKNLGFLGKFGENFMAKNIFAMNGRRSARDIPLREAKLDACQGGLLTERLFEAVRKTDCKNF
jgi:hypothetical protein